MGNCASNKAQQPEEYPNHPARVAYHAKKKGKSGKSKQSGNQRRSEQQGQSEPLELDEIQPAPRPGSRQPTQSSHHSAGSGSKGKAPERQGSGQATTYGGGRDLGSFNTSDAVSKPVRVATSRSQSHGIIVQAAGAQVPPPPTKELGPHPTPGKRSSAKTGMHPGERAEGPKEKSPQPVVPAPTAASDRNSAHTDIDPEASDELTKFFGVPVTYPTFHKTSRAAEDLPDRGESPTAGLYAPQFGSIDQRAATASGPSSSLRPPHASSRGGHAAYRPSSRRDQSGDSDGSEDGSGSSCVTSPSLVGRAL